MVQPVHFPAIRGPAARAALRAPIPAPGFAGVMQEVLQRPAPVRFSAHASQRLADRGLTLTDQDLARVGKAIDDASAKGSRESLLLIDRLALVVSVPNRTVITALELHEAENAVFTNIDSVVIVAGDNSASGENKPGLDPFGEALLPLNDRRGI